MGLIFPTTATWAPTHQRPTAIAPGNSSTCVFTKGLLPSHQGAYSSNAYSNQQTTVMPSTSLTLICVVATSCSHSPTPS
eukprot:9576458-Karenia_brevis.AAC.1